MVKDSDLAQQEAEEEDFDYGEGVFTDDKDIETLRKSAQALGFNPDLVAPKPADGKEGPQYRYFASKNCKHCYGRGTLTVCISPSKQKIFWQNEGLPGRLTLRNKNLSTKKLNKRRKVKRQFPGPSRPRRRQVNGVSIANELHKQWNTRQEEPLSYKEDNTSQAFCKCIRAVEV